MCVCAHTHKQVGNYLRNRYKRVIWLKDPLAQFDLIFLLIKKFFFFFFCWPKIFSGIKFKHKKIQNKYRILKNIC